MDEHAIFTGALERDDPHERQAFLDEACGHDAVLRARIERLLRLHDRTDGFLQVPAGRVADGPRPSEMEEVGTSIGPYRLREKIGEGGFGVVYVAEQSAPIRRKVALKVIKPGMDSKQVVARFEAERQALALMDHPNIAKILDGGATSGGRPYFVMELVKGIPITDYCDRQRLSARERLELFLPVCQAIQHAHHKGIIHRDVKPSNVLVTLHDGRPVPKVIDFGVAKALAQRLTDETVYTSFAQVLGTPLYMSPEQAALSGDEIDTRTDVYALGVLLYELLTGTTPFDRERLRTAGFDEMRRIIREEEPPTPSARLSTLGGGERDCLAEGRSCESRKLAHFFRGELDWVVMKALEKDRNRRYDSAGAFAADVRRYLDDEPVQACPPSALYVLGKFARRHRGLLTVALLLATTLIAGTAVSVWQAVRARDAKHQAQVQATEALEAAGRERQAREDADAERDRARHLLYAGDMLLAGEAWRGNDVTRMRELLDGHKPGPGETDDFRGFVWHFLWKQTGIASRVLVQGDSAAYYVCFSPDGQVLATAGEDAVIRLFDGKTFAPVGEILTGQEEVNGLAFTPDSRTLASAGDDGTLALWNLTTRQKIRSISAFSDLAFQVAFSSDGKVLASCGRDPIIRLWDPATGRSRGKLEYHDKAVEAIALSPRGILAAASRDQRTSIWDLKTQAKIRHILNPGRGAVPAVAFSRTGDRLAQGQLGGLLTLIDVGDEVVVTGRQMVPDGVQSLAFAPAGDRLAVGDRAGGIYLLPGDVSEQETGLAPAAAGERRLFQWQAHQGRVYALTFTPDGQGLVSAGQDGRVVLWDLSERDTEHRISEGADGFVFLDDHRLALAMPGVPVHDLRTGTLRRPPGEDPPSCIRIARAVKAHRLFATDPSRGVLARDEDGGPWAQVWTPPAGSRAQDLVVSANGRFLAVEVAGEHTLALFDLEAQQSVEQFTGAVVERARFSPDGRHVAFTVRKDIRIAETASGKVIQTLQGHTTSVKDLAFSPDGRHLASVSDDRALKVWDWRAGRERWSVLAHRNRAAAVAFSPDGHTIVTAGRDNVLRFWRWEVERLVFQLPTDLRSVSQVAFSPDGRRLACGRPGHEIVVYDATAPRERGVREVHNGEPGLRN
jgi:WD40 repeat protein/serine/threonine protein kinase